MFFTELQASAATYLLTDSRQVSFPEKSIFFAIRGERHDGHQFLPELYGKGVREFVVEKESLTPALRRELAAWPDARIYEVPDSIAALQQMAACHRAAFSVPVIGITGSNGKTIVKEWLTQLLSPGETVASSPKSYNSQIGVPLSVWNLQKEHTIGIFEAGISKPMEMIALQQVIDPTVGIFTNIGTAHDEGFKSSRQKIAEKLKLFVKSEKLIYRGDYKELAGEITLLLRPVNPSIRLLSWAVDDPASDIHVQYTRDGEQSLIRLSGWLGVHVFRTAFKDEASLENLTHCLVFLLDYGLDDTAIQERVVRLRPVNMRLELKAGINGSYLIDDAYNNDLFGLSMALNYLSAQEQRPRKAVVLSDILQAGQKPEDLYRRVGQLLGSVSIDAFIGIGSEIGRYRHLIPVGNAFYYPDVSEFLKRHPVMSLAGTVMLVKGARTFGFERIVNRFQQKIHSTVLEIDLDAITHNLNFYRAKAGAGVKVMAMVKAFAYGSGSAEIAGLLQFHRVDYLGVAYADEGVLLRQSGITLPIMVMNAMPVTFDTLLAYNLEPEIYSERLLTAWLAFSERVSNAAEIPAMHLKLDTGMHRLGFTEPDYPRLAEQLRNCRDVKVASIFSHLVGADEGVHNPFSREQYERFKRGVTYLESVLGRPVLKHILNSAGIVRFPEYRLDMVRLGIGLYGIEATGQEQHHLQTVGTLKTVISQIKTIPAGETVGYSRKGMLDHEARIATIALGYADGFDRRFGNGTGHVYVNGVKCPVVGNVCMDMTMVDVTGTRAEEGDEVIVFGKDLPVWGLAQTIGTIPYELFTGVSDRVKRVFFKS